MRCGGHTSHGGAFEGCHVTVGLGDGGLGRCTNGLRGHVWCTIRVGRRGRGIEVDGLEAVGLVDLACPVKLYVFVRCWVDGCAGWDGVSYLILDLMSHLLLSCIHLSSLGFLFTRSILILCSVSLLLSPHFWFFVLLLLDLRYGTV